MMKNFKALNLFLGKSSPKEISAAIINNIVNKYKKDEGLSSLQKIGILAAEINVDLAVLRKILDGEEMLDENIGLELLTCLPNDTLKDVIPLRQLSDNEFLIVKNALLPGGGNSAVLTYVRMEILKELGEVSRGVTTIPETDPKELLKNVCLEFSDPSMLSIYGGEELVKWWKEQEDGLIAEIPFIEKRLEAADNEARECEKRLKDLTNEGIYLRTKLDKIKRFEKIN